MFRKASALLAAGLLAAAAAADTPAGGGPEGVREAVSARTQEVRAEIAKLEGDASPAGSARRRRLERLERMLSRHQEALRRADELAAQRAELEAARRRDLAEQVGKPPFRVADYDAALAALSDAEQVLAGLEEAAQDASNSVEEARKLFEKRKELRDAEEGEAPGGEAPAPPEAGTQEERRATAALLLEIAERNLDQRRQKLDNAREAAALQQQVIAERRRQVDWIADRVAATDRELEDALDALDAEGVALKRRRERAELEEGAARRRWESAEKRIARAAEVGPVEQAESAALRAELAAHQKEVTLLGERLDGLEHAREAVQHRFAVLSGRASRDDERRWLAESQEALAAILREKRIGRAELEAHNQELAALQSELPPGEEATWRQRQIQALRGQITATEEGLENLDGAQLREERLALAAERALGGGNLVARARALLDSAGDLWSYEITRTEDRSITVGRVVSATLAFLLGVVVARLLAHGLAARLLRRFGFDEGAAAAYQSLIYYGFVAFAFLLALRSVDIPLTAFALVGGALAIGLGFGSQNIVNNFISGLILLAERPIKKGDLVQVDDTYGNVERIGLRSTRIRTGANIHVIVPNSAFLENNVTNWTHTDPEVGIKISVGVAYGTPPREVEKLLLRALAEQPEVLTKPAPAVLFSEFGESALQFEAHFRVRIYSMGERARIESALRYRIDDLFRESGLVMAFPQRDVHLDAAAPIPVRLVGSDEATPR